MNAICNMVDRQGPHLSWERCAAQYEGVLHSLRTAATSEAIRHEPSDRIDEIRCHALELFARSVRALPDRDALKFKERCEILEEEILVSDSDTIA